MWMCAHILLSSHSLSSFHLCVLGERQTANFDYFMHSLNDLYVLRPTAVRTQSDSANLKFL